MIDQSAENSVLILGRALHAPWNEGTRVIARDTARVMNALRPVRAVSITHERFSGQQDDSLRAQHIYTRLPYGVRSDYATLGRTLHTVQQIVRSNRIEVAHLVGLPLALAPWLRRWGIRVVAHIVLAQQSYHGRIERFRAALGWRCFNHWVDSYACTSEHVRTQLAAQNYPAAKLHIVPPPLDVQHFQRVDRAAARQELGLPDDAFAVVYVGTISPLRFPAEAILQALHLVAPDIPKLRLAVFAPVSTHPYNDEWAAGHIHRAISGSMLPVSVQLRDLTEAQKVTLYSAADVVLLPFNAPVAVEPPLTLLEAMACESIVAVAPFANRSQIVANYANGVAFNAPEELADHLKQLYARGPSFRAELGRSARNWIVERYSFTAVAEAINSVWNGLGLRAIGLPA
jgi:glycosyltransferase involved in cell wall biosynthesis